MVSRLILVLLPVLALSACATAAPPTGFLSGPAQLREREGGLRTKIAEAREEAALAAIRTVRLEPTVFAEGAQADWLNAEERALLLREMDAQLCFEMSKRYALTTGAPDAPPPEATVRAAIASVAPTGRVASAVSAAASFFIPGPIGLRAPGSTGALATEAEILTADGRQIGAMTWSRAATVVGTDDPSLSRIGDAMRFAEAFADDAAKVLSADGARRRVQTPDPCAEYGPRVRPEGFIASLLTNLYIPQASRARGQAAPAGPAQPSPAPQP